METAVDIMAASDPHRHRRGGANRDASIRGAGSRVSGFRWPEVSDYPWPLTPKGCKGGVWGRCHPLNPRLAERRIDQITEPSTARVIEKHRNSLRSGPNSTLLRVIAYEALVAWLVEHGKVNGELVAHVCSDVAVHWSNVAREEENTNARHAIVYVAHILEEIGDEIDY